MSVKPKKNTKKAKIHWPSVVLIIGIVLLLIPSVVIGMVLLDAFEGTGKPIFGNRFTTEINNPLTNDQLEAIDASISEKPNVKKVTVNLKSATLRINVLIENDLDDEQVITLSSLIMESIFEVAPREDYFKMQAMHKQYDLEVHVFNDRTVVAIEDYVYVIVHLNSLMEEPYIQLVSQPKNPEFVQNLYDSLFNDDDDEDDEN